MSDLPEFALSIRQPWCWAILHGGKDIENRDWPTRMRGRICLHASKGMTRGEYEDCLATIHAISEVRPFPSGLTLPAFDDLERGGIVGTVAITDCVSASASPWFFGRYGFALRNAEATEFIPVKGALGFFKWRDNLETAPPAEPQGRLL
ncbi:ASCH domain-containing protein [Mesorhizobium sp.]|uniref:ASCH domain-containing protein n=1 Tax=Mesorhizobium sp. TaxID=1871066 RepID=UPI00120C438D|nr:ASCH domain-containing protein [Mesorhizobium sp.]TIN82671.1 MAG: ASCH domain-containing protein [Mesorhizobium sp.]